MAAMDRCSPRHFATGFLGGSAVGWVVAVGPGGWGVFVGVCDGVVGCCCVVAGGCCVFAGVRCVASPCFLEWPSKR